MTYNTLIAAIYLSTISFTLLSCSDVPNQYSTTSPKANPDRTLSTPPVLLTEPTQPDGGYLLYQELELSEEQKDTVIRKNSLVPISYKNSSAGNISIKTEYKTAADVLHFSHTSSTGLHIYKEGMVVGWRSDPPRTPYVIFLFSQYQGTMDFGPWIDEDKRHRRVGESFANHFSVGTKDIQKDKKAQHFITSLYKYLENTEEDCLKNQKCHLSIGSQGNYILFQLPKMTFLFENNKRQILIQIAIINNNEPGCFNSPFDILNTKFFCKTSEDGSHLTLKLGDPYQEVLQKSGIRPDLPIIYGNTRFIQVTHSTNIGWRRYNFEEESKTIPERSHLSYVSMKNNYTTPFLIDHSLIKVSIIDSNKLNLQLDPLNPTEKQKWTIKNIEDKKKALVQSKEETSFYLSTSMPQIKKNYTLQKALIKALLNLLEERYKELYSDASESFKIYKRIYGEYNDTHALEASGILVIPFQTQKDTLVFDISINESSGIVNISVALIENDFSNYVLKNQHPVDLNQPVTSLTGFTLGDKIYLRDKKIGAKTAIVAYITENHQILTTLADYSYEAEAAVVYNSGRDKNITFQKSEAVLVWIGTTLIINPTFQTKKIDDKTFDEYEINGIISASFSFFNTINNLCKIDNFNIEMGMYDRLFTQTLSKKIASIKNRSTTEISCSYISPQDGLFSSLKRTYFFPDHKIAFGFRSRELYSVQIYKKPSKTKNGNKSK